MVEVLDRRSQILAAALGEFAAKGYKGATIKSIAAAAELQSPALIYHYFPDKEALFDEVLELHVPVVQAVADPAPLMDLPPEEVLPKIGRAYLAFNRPNTQVLRIIIAEAIRRPEVAETFLKGGPERVLGFLKAYMERQIALGQLRPHDARSSARAFIGMIMPQVLGKVLFFSLMDDGLTDEEHLENVVAVFLDGLRPERS